MELGGCKERLRLEAELVFGDVVDEVDLVVEREGPPDQAKSTSRSNQIQHASSTSIAYEGGGSRCVPERREVPEPGSVGVGDGIAPQRPHQRRQRLLPPRRRHVHLLFLAAGRWGRVLF